MDWIDLAKDRGRWRVHVTAVRILEFHKMRGIP